MHTETLPSPTAAVVPGRLVFHRDEPSRFGAIEVLSHDGLVKGLSMKQQQILPFEPEALLTAAQLAEVLIDLAGQAATPASADQLAAYARTLAEAYGAHSQAGDLAVGDFASHSGRPQPPSQQALVARPCPLAYPLAGAPGELSRTHLPPYGAEPRYRRSAFCR